MAKMKSLRYFETLADDIRINAIDYRLISRKDLILILMKNYRRENNISWMDYKKTFDKYFNKYCF